MGNTLGLHLSGLAAAVLASACAGDPLPKPSPDFATSPFPDWTVAAAETTLFPGDRIALAFRTAPELNADYVIGPDGRIVPPLIGPVMAAGRTPTSLAWELQSAFRAELLDPALAVTPLSFDSQKVFVGGDVRTPGVYDLPGAIDPLQAIILAGGWTDTARPTRVIVFRRGPNGEVKSRVLNVRRGLSDPSIYDIGPLQRFDIVYVTRKAIADENLFIRQYIRDALPVSFGLYYDVARF
ncbi:polysaccharide export protein [bacterium]|nr:polysaccharide export protein [bacterium]